MADAKISALTSKATPVNADTVHILDSVGGADKKTTLGALPVSTAQATAIALKANASAVTNVDNTSDANKPVSTAQATADGLRNLKSANLSDVASANTARNNINKGTTAITDAATIATDCSLGNVFTVTLGGNRTLGNPTNQQDGATYIYRINQDATGSRTLAYGSAFKFSGGIAPILTTATLSKDRLSCVSDGTLMECTFIPDVR